MKRKLCIVIALGLAACLQATPPTGDLTENLIRDGGMENWVETAPNTGNWKYWTVKGETTVFAKTAQGGILTPSILSQMYDTRTMKPEETDVRSGKKALRLKGQFYLAPGIADAYKAKVDDVYYVRYWVKGAGDSLMHMHIYGDANTEFLEVKGKPDKERWTMIEERILVVGRAPTTIFPRLWASEEVLIDDVFIGRVLRPEERRQDVVPAELQERIAFASPVEGAVSLDGKLEETSWSKAVAFSGFRPHGDQTLLSPEQPSFKVLYDRDNLYFGLEILLKDAEQVLEALKKQPLLDGTGKPRSMTDTYTSRHAVELFLQAPGKSRYCQFAASLDGYRYDGAGMDGAWNGTWESAVSVTPDRWFLEISIPARDLGIDRVETTDGWRLNLCHGATGGSSTWAAVGQNFHNPGGFGKLITQEFGAWHTQQPVLRAKMKAEILRTAGTRADVYAARLAALDAAVPTAVGESTAPVQDWQAITRVYSQLDYIGYAYRCAAEEVRYCNFLQ